MKSCVIRMTKKQNFGSLSNCRYCADCAQNTTFGSHCSRFHPNRFTFGGVIYALSRTRKQRSFVPYIVFPFAGSEASLQANHALRLTNSTDAHPMGRAYKRFPYKTFHKQDFSRTITFPDNTHYGVVCRPKV